MRPHRQPDQTLRIRVCIPVIDSQPVARVAGLRPNRLWGHEKGSNTEDDKTAKDWLQGNSPYLDRLMEPRRFYPPAAQLDCTGSLYGIFNSVQ
jgi:hypothetical protein